MTKSEWRTSGTPYLKVPTEAFDAPAKKVVMKYASSRGKSEPAQLYRKRVRRDGWLAMVLRSPFLLLAVVVTAPVVAFLWLLEGLEDAMGRLPFRWGKR